MTRHEIAVLIWESRLRELRGKSLTQKMVVTIVNTVFQLMKEALLRGELVRIDKLGSFHPKAYPPKRSWSHTKKKLVDSRPYLKVHFALGRSVKNAAKDMLEDRGLNG